MRRSPYNRPSPCPYPSSHERSFSMKYASTTVRSPGDSARCASDEVSARDCVVDARPPSRRCKNRSVDIEHPERDQGWDHAAREETLAERLDRNWSVLLQELCVTQTGV